MVLKKAKVTVKQGIFSVTKHLPAGTAVRAIWAATYPIDRALQLKRGKQVDRAPEKGKQDWNAYYRKKFPHGYEPLASEHNMDRRFEAIAPFAKGKIVEVGCADGYFARKFAQRGHETIGIDLSAHFIGMAKQRAKEQGLKNIEFKLGDAERIPIKSGEADTVFLGQVLEHVENLKRALEEAARVVKPGGNIIITVPTHLMGTPEHVRTVFPSKLKRLLKPYAQIIKMKQLNFDQYLCVARRLE